MERWIRRETFRKYPKTEKERQGCRQEIERMKYLRDQYAKRLNENEGSKTDSGCKENG